MCDKLSILLVEDDEDTCHEFIDYVNTLDDVYLTNITNDSYTAIQYVKDELPSAVILDLELSRGNGNGLTFLHDLKMIGTQSRPFILITTNNSSQITYSHARNSGADFILYKHQKDYSVKMVIDFLYSMKNEIISMSHHDNKTQSNAVSKEDQYVRINKRIESELLKVGISPKAKGFNYLFEAINLYLVDTTTHITQIIAAQHKKSEPSVERAMQNAINKAWITSDTEDLYKYYTAVIRADKGVPTLLEFVSYYANKIKNDY